MSRGETEFRYSHGELHSNEPAVGDLRRRLSGPDERDPVQLGEPDLYKRAREILGDRISAEVAPGIYARRDALGGISLSTGNVRDRMGFETEPSREPAVSPEVAPEAKPKRALADPVAILTAHLPRSARATAVSPKATPEAPFIVNPFASNPVSRELSEEFK